MLKLIRAIIHFFYCCQDVNDDGGLASLLTWLMSNWVFIPFWLFVSNEMQAEAISTSQLLWGLPIVTLIIFPIGAIQYGLYSLTLSALHRLLGEPRIIAD